MTISLIKTAINMGLLDAAYLLENTILVLSRGGAFAPYF